MDRNTSLRQVWIGVEERRLMAEKYSFSFAIKKIKSNI